MTKELSPEWHQIFVAGVNTAWADRRRIKTLEDALACLDEIRGRMELAVQNKKPLPVKRNRVSVTKMAWSEDGD